MISIARHGRLQRITKITRFAIFITGMSTLMIGGVMSISSFHQTQQEAQIRINQNLKTNAQVLVDQFFSMIETIKSGADLSQVPYVTHRAVVKVSQDVPSEIESMDFIGHKDGANAQDYALEERLLKAIKKQISINDIHVGQGVLGTYELSDVGSKEGIFYVTPYFAAPSTNAPAAESATENKNSVTTTNSSAETEPPSKFERLSVILINPSKALASITKLGISEKENHLNAFLINKNGKILAHTLPAYVGTDLKKLETLQPTIENLFLGAQTGDVTKYRSIDGDRQQIAFVRVGANPFAIAVEQKAISPVLSSAWVNEQINSGAARRNLGLILILFAGAMILMTGVSFWFNYEIKRTLADSENAFDANDTDTVAEENISNSWIKIKRPIPNVTVATNTASSEPVVTQTIESVVEETESKPQTIVLTAVTNKTETKTAEEPISFKMEESDAAQAASQFIETRLQLDEEIKNADHQAQNIAVASVTNPASGALEYVSRISNAYTAEAIERELVDACSKITESPTLYFRYYRRNQNLVLSAAAGAVKIQNHAAMQVYVRKDIEQAVEQLSNQGKVASITNYAPMAKLMISNLNVAHFEAWAVTCDRSVNAGGSEILGVMVVLQAGFKSAEARPVLGRMLRETGNYLYALNNKLRTGNTVNTGGETTSTYNSGHERSSPSATL